MLSVEDLTILHSMGSTPSVIAEGISFRLKRGDSLGIVGESGSGKTITALSLLQLLPYGMEISSGKILYTSEKGETVNLADIALKSMWFYRGRAIAISLESRPR